MDYSSSMSMVMVDICSRLVEEDRRVTMLALSNNITSNTLNSTFHNSTTSSQLLKLCSEEVDNDLFMDLPPAPNSMLLLVQYYLSGICGLIVCVFGLIGNMISLMIMTGKHFKKSSTYVYLSALLVSDSFVLIFALLINLKDIFEMTKSQLFNSYSAYTWPFFHPLANTFQCTSIWLTLGFTTDRYIMICHPFQGSKFCSRKRAIKVVVLIYLLGLCYNLPRFFEYKTVVEKIGEKEIVYFMYTEVGGSQVFLQIVHFWSYLICIFVVPCTTLAVLNTLLLLAVKKSRSVSRKISLGKINLHKTDTTVMLVAVVIVFFVCQMPALISHTVWASMPSKLVQGGDKYKHLNIIQEIANFLVILNSAINILLYCTFSKKFRVGFKEIFCSRFKNSKYAFNDNSEAYSNIYTNRPSRFNGAPRTTRGNTETTLCGQYELGRNNSHEEMELLRKNGTTFS